MSEDGQRGPGSGGPAQRGRPGTGQARRDAGGENPPGDGQDHVGTPRPDALIPLIDYVMTVAVSIASGVAAITSAYPSMRPTTVWIGVGVIVILLAGNLRGVRQAGTVFAVPTYAFIAAIAALVAAGLVHAAGRGFHPVPVRHLAIMQSVTVLLVLRAFASGSTAAERLQPILQSLPRVVVTSVPFHLAD